MLTQFYRTCNALVVIALVGAASLSVPDKAGACLAVSRPGDNVSVSEESAVIVWNPAQHLEHFIRRASFATNASDLGFLVPTPTTPTLAEASGQVFETLRKRTAPPFKIEERTELYLTSWILHSLRSQERPATTAALAGFPAAIPPVRVLQTARVGQYDATVLEADDAAALLGWLKKHGYEARPAIIPWLTPYVAAGWKITAYKIAAGEGPGNLSSGTVRMSFRTDHPFFPYREPADQRESGRFSPRRLLRVYFLASKRMEGGLSVDKVKPWPGVTIWADGLHNAELPELAKLLALPPEQMPDGPWLTAFEDRSSPRPGTDDLYFRASQTQTPVLPPEITKIKLDRIGVPLDWLLIITIFAAIAIRAAQRLTKTV